jgi:DNA-binding transcriptional LysR family regulator
MHRDGWLGIELRHFAALKAVAQERSFRGAATQLGYVQSAISRQIAYLEQMTGARLIERSQGPRPVYLTDVGQLLLAHANDILASIEAAKSDVGRLTSEEAHQIRIGVFPGGPTRALPRALVALAKQSPDARVVVTEAVTDMPFFDLVRDGSLDLAFAHLPPEHGPFITREILPVPWVLVVSAGSELAGRETPPTAAEIARQPLIGLKSPRLASLVEEQLRAEAGPPRVVFRSDMAETAQALAEAGVGAALMPRLAVEERNPRTAMIDLGHLVRPLILGLIWHRGRRLPPTVLEFADIVRRACRGVAGQGTGRFSRERTAEPAAPSRGSPRGDPSLSYVMDQMRQRDAQALLSSMR